MNTELSGGNEQNLNSIVEETKGLLGAARSAIIYAARNLYFIKQNLPAGTKFGEFVEEHLGIDETSASKWVGNYTYYVEQGGLDIEKVAGIDQDKLSLAKKLTGTVEEKLAKADTLRRSDLRREKQDDDPHAFEAREICKVCGSTRENHS